MSNIITAVFDFDGTIIPHDTGREFNKWLIKKSIFRSALMIIVFPLYLLLISNSYTLKTGLNLGCYIATAFQKKSLFKIRNEFMAYFFKVIGAVPLKLALERVRSHQAHGDKVVIISGCPNWLLYKVARHIGLREVTYIGSEFRLFLTGLVLDKHCYASNKLIMALENGQRPETWSKGYSDSLTDLPMLNECNEAFLINATKKIKRKINGCENSKISTLTWI